MSPIGSRRLEPLGLGSKGCTEEALSPLRSAIDQGGGFALQGYGTAAAAALIDAIDKHRERVPERRVAFLDDSAVGPSLTSERCSALRFHFDVHADARLAALTETLRGDAAGKKVYLIGPD